ncbi:hypothetical protein [Candidatus Synchoanobacter obligatus]|uniref:Uncharacterized protein n=1 Tax=Candidatus Synchoanobacter obligatus TaxID=2919597 RepID=A0ABT1L4N9_9GAMM|nr:hypothetical protein [Candidatus Synchoanobacter obligatus]MCP8352121.1 hypothetical protein [Candidatus Synchoanobacter obligatus]
MTYYYPYHPDADQSNVYKSERPIGALTYRYAGTDADQALRCFNQWFASFGLVALNWVSGPFQPKGQKYIVRDKAQDYVLYFHESIPSVRYHIDGGYWDYSTEAQASSYLVASEKNTILALSQILRGLGSEQSLAIQSLEIQQGNANLPNKGVVYPFLCQVQNTLHVIHDPDGRHGALDVLKDLVTIDAPKEIFRPQAFFDQQFISLNKGLFVRAYQEMLQIDGVYRKRKITYDVSDHTVVLRAQQYGFGPVVYRSIKSCRIVPVRAKIKQCFFPTQQYVFRLNHEYVVAIFEQKKSLVAIKEGDAFIDDQWLAVLLYAEVMPQILSESKVYYQTEYQITWPKKEEHAISYVGHHVICSESSRAQADLSQVRYTREPVQSESPELDLAFHESLYQKNLNQQLKPRWHLNHHEKILGCIVLAVMFVVWLILEIVAAAKKWRVGAGLFQGVRVWHLGLSFGFMCVVLSVILWKAYNFWKSIPRQSLKQWPSVKFDGRSSVYRVPMTPEDIQARESIVLDPIPERVVRELEFNALGILGY